VLPTKLRTSAKRPFAPLAWFACFFYHCVNPFEGDCPLSPSCSGCFSCAVLSVLLFLWCWPNPHRAGLSAASREDQGQKPRESTKRCLMLPKGWLGGKKKRNGPISVWILAPKGHSSWIAARVRIQRKNGLLSSPQTCLSRVPDSRSAE
jgi:hypothetical protein